MIVSIADGFFCLVLLTLTILALTMPSGAVHPIMPALVAGIQWSASAGTKALVDRSLRWGDE